MGLGTKGVCFGVCFGQKVEALVAVHPNEKLECSFTNKKATRRNEHSSTEQMAVRRVVVRT